MVSGENIEGQNVFFTKTLVSQLFETKHFWF